MRTQITDPDVQLLASISGTIQQDYVTEGEDPWEGSPFEWIVRTGSSRRKGAIGEKLVAGWAAAKGLDVTRSPNSQADRVIEGHLVEIKFSTLWENGTYTFQQVREQAYNVLFCLGVSPFDAHAWVVPKDVLREHVIGVTGQHTGASGQDTAWMKNVSAANPPVWLRPYGGTLREAFAVLKSLGRDTNGQNGR